MTKNKYKTGFIAIDENAEVKRTYEMLMDKVDALARTYISGMQLSSNKDGDDYPTFYLSNMSEFASLMEDVHYYIGDLMEGLENDMLDRVNKAKEEKK